MTSVAYVPPAAQEAPALVRIHAGLRVLEQVSPGPPIATAESGGGGSLPTGEEWLVTVPAPAAGCTDYLVLESRYAHAANQWQLCAEALADGANLSIRMQFLAHGALEWC